MAQELTRSPQQTRQLAADLVQDPPASVFALVGPLGAGKTVFAQGVGKAFNIDSMLSPTYTLIREYDLDHPDFSALYHIDLYRLDTIEEIMDLGLEEIWSDPQHLVLIEWADKIENQLPENHLRLDFKIIGQDTRQITYLK